jgi:arylsulfatase A-like enzyme
LQNARTKIQNALQQGLSLREAALFDFWGHQLQTSDGFISIVCMKSPVYLLLLLSLTLLACETPPPNILFIMADDHSSQAFGLYGNELDAWVQADQIQRLAREGMRLDRVYCTNSICVPSRATILTGQYSHRNGVYTLNDALPTEVEHVGHLMQKGGYQTALVGKWHLKKEPQGFDYYNVLPGQGLYQNPLLKEKGQAWQDANKGGEQYQGFSTDVITDQALGWLQAREPDKPFMLMCHFKAVHEPFGFAERFQDLYQNDSLPLPASLFEDRSHRSAGSRDKGIFMQDLLWRYTNWTKRYPNPPLDTTGMSEEEAIRAVCQKLRKDYLRGVAGINENLGRILDYLDRNGLAENTVVVYTSDQGYFLGEHGYMDKRWMLEESARMPFVVRYPREIKAGSENQDLILNVDFAPTFLDWAGIVKPKQMQGRSFRENLQERTPGDWRQSFYYRYWMQERRPAHFGIRNDRYKLIFFYGLPLDKTQAEPSPPGWELFDLEKDPREEHNVYGDPAYAEVVDELKAEMLRWREELGDMDEDYPEIEELLTRKM